MRVGPEPLAAGGDQVRGHSARKGSSAATAPRSASSTRSRSSGERSEPSVDGQVARAGGSAGSGLATTLQRLRNSLDRGARGFRTTESTRLGALLVQIETPRTADTPAGWRSSPIDTVTDVHPAAHERRSIVFERFTDRARRVVVLAQEEARLLNHNYIGTEHILLGLIHEGEGVAAKALESLGISLEAVRAQVEEIIGHGGPAPSGHIPFTPRAKKVLELSLREALQLGHNYIGTEHILLGLIREGEGVAAQVLVKLGADLSRVRQQVIQLLSGYAGAQGGGRRTGPAAARREAQPSGSLVLDQFGRNLTQLAREKKLDPVIGREQEIERVMQVLQPPHQEQPGAHR